MRLGCPSLVCVPPPGQAAQTTVVEVRLHRALGKHLRHVSQSRSRSDDADRGTLHAGVDLYLRVAQHYCELVWAMLRCSIKVESTSKKHGPVPHQHAWRMHTGTCPDHGCPIAAICLMRDLQGADAGTLRMCQRRLDAGCCPSVGPACRSYSRSHRTLRNGVSPNGGLRHRHLRSGGRQDGGALRRRKRDALRAGRWSCCWATVSHGCIGRADYRLTWAIREGIVSRTFRTDMHAFALGGIHIAVFRAKAAVDF